MNTKFSRADAVSHSYSWNGVSYSWLITAETLEDGRNVRHVFHHGNHAYLGTFEMDEGAGTRAAANLGAYGEKIVPILKGEGGEFAAGNNIEGVILRLVEFCRERVSA